jgi:hypothetical protein
MEWLHALEARCGPDTKIQGVVDAHPVLTSKETRADLATRPNRSSFVFTPVQPSWSNLIAMFLPT